MLFQTKSHVAWTSLKLAMYLKLALTTDPLDVCLPSAGITGTKPNRIKRSLKVNIWKCSVM